MVWDRTVEKVARAFHEAGGATWEDAGEDIRRELLTTVEDAIAANRELFLAMMKADFDHALGDDDEAKLEARIDKILEPIIATRRP